MGRSNSDYRNKCVSPVEYQTTNSRMFAKPQLYYPQARNLKVTGKETHNDVSQGLKNYDNRHLVGKTEFKKTND